MWTETYFTVASHSFLAASGAMLSDCSLGFCQLPSAKVLSDQRMLKRVDICSNFLCMLIGSCKSFLRQLQANKLSARDTLGSSRAFKQHFEQGSQAPSLRLQNSCFQQDAMTCIWGYLLAGTMCTSASIHTLLLDVLSACVIHKGCFPSARKCKANTLMQPKCPDARRVSETLVACMYPSGLRGCLLATAGCSARYLLATHCFLASCYRLCHSCNEMHWVANGGTFTVLASVLRRTSSLRFSTRCLPVRTAS